MMGCTNSLNKGHTGTCSSTNILHTENRIEYIIMIGHVKEEYLYHTQKKILRCF